MSSLALNRTSNSCFLVELTVDSMLLLRDRMYVDGLANAESLSLNNLPTVVLCTPSSGAAERLFKWGAKGNERMSFNSRENF